MATNAVSHAPTTHRLRHRIKLRSPAGRAFAPHQSTRPGGLHVSGRGGVGELTTRARARGAGSAEASPDSAASRRAAVSARRSEEASVPARQGLGEAKAQSDEGWLGGDISPQFLEAEPTYDTVLGALRSIDLPWSAARTTVLPTGVTAVQATCLGLVGKRRPVRSPATLAAPNLCRLLARYFDGPDGPLQGRSRPAPEAAAGLRHASDARGAEGADFCFSSIQVNANYAAKEHVDAGNVGLSYLVALGEFEGGELVVAGQPHCVRDRWVLFDGRSPHSVAAFTGERYSLVYFCNAAHARSQEGELQGLQQLGFRVQPLMHHALCNLGDAKQRLQLVAPRVVALRGLSKGIGVQSRRTDMAAWCSEVRQWLVGTLDGAGVEVEDIVLCRDGVRPRASNIGFAVLANPDEVHGAVATLTAASTGALVAEEYAM